jgi:hypothetical protein
MMRAQFWNRIHYDHSTNSWHLNLAPSVKRARRMQVPFGFWFFGTDASGAIEFTRTLFLTTFTLPTNGKEFTVPVELSISGSGILDNGEVFGFGGGKRGKITFDYVDGFYLPGNFVPAPEPGTIVLMGSGLIGVAALARKRLNL